MSHLKLDWKLVFCTLRPEITDYLTNAKLLPYVAKLLVKLHSSFVQQHKLKCFVAILCHLNLNFLSVRATFCSQI